MNALQPNQLAALALVLFALALLMIAGLVLARIAAARRSARTLSSALDQRAVAIAAAAAVSAAAGAGAGAGDVRGSGAGLNAAGQSGAARAGANASPARNQGFAGALQRLGDAGVRWLDTPFGRQVVADEDRRFLEQCGFVDVRTRGLFLVARVACALVALVLAIWLADLHGGRLVIVPACALIVGFMAPKFAIRRRASQRRLAVVDELPLLVDLLRLLQGVGLSLDQSLQVMVNDFRGMLPVLAGELEIAQRQFSAGRTREQSLQRLASNYANEDLHAIVRLLVQVDRHGGAVQEPLKQFGDRLREARRAMLRERIGRLTVKMTGVMILTLLPALLIVTAGPGLMTVKQSLRAMHR